MADYIAVYGSLRQGMQAECKMQRMEFVGRGRISASLYALGWYPGVKLGEGSTVVDLFRLSEDEQLRKAILYDLDNYEGYSEKYPENSLFVRKVVSVTTEQGDEVKAYTYEYDYPVNRAPLIEDGDWVKFCEGGMKNGLQNATA